MTTTSNAAFSGKILHLITDLHLTQDQLAERLKCTKALAKKILSGHQPGLWKTHKKIQELIGVKEEDYKALLGNPDRVRAKPRRRMPITMLKTKLAHIPVRGSVAEADPTMDQPAVPAVADGIDPTSADVVAE